MILSVYAPERSEEGKNVFWKKLIECFGSYDERDRILVPEDVNARVDGMAVEGIIN